MAERPPEHPPEAGADEQGDRRATPVSVSAVIMPFEVIVGALSAWWLAGEAPTLLESFGVRVSQSLATIIDAAWGYLEAGNDPQHWGADQIIQRSEQLEFALLHFDAKMAQTGER